MSSQPAAAASWIGDLFASIDRRDTPAFAGFLAEDATFRFGNQEPVHGRAAIADAVDQFFQHLAGVEHRIEKSWEVDDAVIVTGEVTYTRLDGSEVTLPFADVFQMRGRLVREYLIYIDVTPLFAEAA